jgi:hypothetical protein
MFKKIRTRIAALAVAGLVLGGGAAVVSEVAEPAIVTTAQHFGVPLKEDAAVALTFYKYSYCPTQGWEPRVYGWRSATTINTSGGFKMRVDGKWHDSGWFFVKSGWYGSGTKTIYAGTEDAKFTLDIPSSSALYSWTTSCYWKMAP